MNQVTGDQTGKFVLLVDDDPIRRKLLTIYLSGENFLVGIAVDGQDALTKLRTRIPDIVVSDALMPNMDGFSLCQAIRADPLLRHIPVVLISAMFIAPEDRDFASRVGANDLLDFSEGGTEVCLSAIRNALSSGAPITKSTPADYLHQEKLIRFSTLLQEIQSANQDLSAVQGASLSTLYAMSSAMSRHINPEELFDEILGVILDATDSLFVGIHLIDSHGPIRVTAAEENASAKIARVLLDQIAAWLEILGQRSFIIVSHDDPDGASLLGPLAISDALLVAVTGAGARVGFLIFGFKKPCPETCVTLARRIGIQLGQALVLQAALARATIAEQRYRSILEKATDGITTLTPEGIMLEANPRYEEICGWSIEEMRGRHFTEFLAPDTMAYDADRFRKFLEQGVDQVNDVQLVRKGGKRIFVDFAAFLVTVGDRQIVLSLARDATQRRSVEAQVRQLQKMESIGELTGGVAHDFNNILMAILGNAEILLSIIPEHEKTRYEVEEIRKAGERGATLTRQLLAFARQHAIEPTFVNLTSVVESLVGMLRRLIGEQIELQTIGVADLGTVRADAGQIEQVIVNLAVNARDAMPNGGRLIIETSNRDLDESYAKSHPGVQPGPYVSLIVSDSGSGMDTETQNRIFEPFFTTKERGQGTGLGLSTCYGIIRQSAGHIRVYSEPGKGTTFNIFLPRVEDRPAVAHVARQESISRGSETILLIEDDPNVREVIERMLQSRGYTVLAAADGPEAIAIADRQKGAIELILSDMNLPGADGPSIAKGIILTRPGTKVLFMSGYSERLIADGKDIGADVSFLQKPFGSEELSQKIRRLLAQT